MASSSRSLHERIHEEGTPLIDGDQVTFVWEGETAPELIGDFNDWGRSPSGTAYLTRAAPNTWTYSITLPEDAYIEYIFTTDADDPEASLLDPHNRHQVSNGIGGTNNYFLMPSLPEFTLDKFISGIPQGNVTRHVINSEHLLFGGRRDVWLYRPAVKTPVPLLVVLDGRDYMRLADITQIVANMIGLGEIQPIALAMIDNAKQARFLEYNNSETFVMTVMQLLMPLAKSRLNLIDVERQPGVFGIMGASIGGTQALYTAMRQPSVFGKVIAQSGAFNLQVNGVDSIVMKLVKDASKKDLKLWFECGIFDSDLLDDNRAMRDLLSQRGYDFTYREFSGGHNYSAWSYGLPHALRAMFPPLE